MVRASKLVLLWIVTAPLVAVANQDVESKWLGKIIKDLDKEIAAGCEYSFDDVSDKWIGLNGWRLETWHFTVCGESIQFDVRFYPEDPGANQDERIEVERAAAEIPPPPGVPPIDSEEEAVYVAKRDYFMLQSCVSPQFRTTVKEFDSYWTVTSIDMKPLGERPCRTMVVSICKSDGRLIYEKSEINCETQK